MTTTFKVISIGRVGTLAINRWLEEHPQIQLPFYMDTKKILDSKEEVFTGGHYKFNPSIKAKGIILHATSIFEKKGRKNLARFNSLHSDTTLHLVRHPYEQIRGWINHINTSAIIGYSSWNPLPPTAKAFYKLHRNLVPSLLPGMQCERLYNKSKKVICIDFHELGEKQSKDTLKKIHEFIGVDSEFQSAMIEEDQNNTTRELLKRGIQFTLNNENLHMRMYPISLFKLLHKDKTPWVTIHDMDNIFKLCPSVKPISGDIVFLPDNEEAHNRLSYKTRKMLHEGLQNIIAELLPQWAKQAESDSLRINEAKITKLSEEDLFFLKQVCERDFKIFARYQPRFEKLWEI